MRSPLFAALPALAFGLAGCSQSSQVYPSLLPRPIEKQSLAEPVRPVAVVTPDPALDRRIAELSAQLQSGNQRFVAAAQQTEAKVAVARGLREGSDAWLDAQIALANLESLRTSTQASVAEFERLAIERGEAGKPAYPALDAQLAAANAATKSQNDRISALEAALGGA